MYNSVFLFLNLGGGEVLIIVIVIIMLFGSDKLPGLAKGIGRGLREINDAKNQIQNEKLILYSFGVLRIHDESWP